MRVRNATETDIPILLKMSKLMHNEGRYVKFDYNEDKVNDLIRFLLKDGIVLVVEDVKVIGGFMGMVTEHFFGHSKSSVDFGVYVLKESRHSKAAMLLIKEYVKQAKDKGATDIGIGNTMGSVGGLYEKMGFSLVGGLYRLEA